MLYCVKDVQARFLEGNYSTLPLRNPLKSPAWHFSGMACPSNCPARLSWHSMLHGATPPDFRNEGRQLSETFGWNFFGVLNVIVNRGLAGFQSEKSPLFF